MVAVQKELDLMDTLPVVKLGKTRSHQIYKTKDGKRVPGVTTILNVRNKGEGLMNWAYNMGLEKQDKDAYMRDMAETGTLLHGMVVAFFQGQQVWMDEWTKEQQDRALICFEKFTAWYFEHDVKLVAAELQLVSDMLKLGGTLDLLVMLDGELTLIDLKTSKAIYDEHILQTITYEAIAREHGHEIQGRGILRLGRTPEEGFEWRPLEVREEYLRVAYLCVEMYEANKKAFGRGY